MIIVSDGLRGYLQDKLKTELTDKAVFIGRLRPDQSVWGVVGFDNFTKYDCEMFMGGDKGWMSKAFLKASFSYPFEQLKLVRVSGRVDSKDKTTLEIDKRMGFRVEGRLRQALGDSDVIVIGMLRSECRWI